MLREITTLDQWWVVRTGTTPRALTQPSARKGRTAPILLVVALGVFALAGIRTPAEGLQVGRGAVLVETPDGVRYCARVQNLESQVADVFGVPVNLSNEFSELFCAGAGAVPGHCASTPGGVLSFDFVPRAIGGPSGCGSVSYVSEAFTNVTGSFASQLPSEVTLTMDGYLHQIGPQPASTLPGCTLEGPVMLFQGTWVLNAFGSVPTSEGLNQTLPVDAVFVDPQTGASTSVQLDLSFGEVTQAGGTTVTTSSSAAGALASNFAAEVNGFKAVFLDIRTTATVVPPIVVCSPYPDADQDGFLDGTNPPVPESAISFLHGEGDPVVFVDRTSSRDPVANKICATVDHLSPFAVVVRTNGICSTVNAPCDDGNSCTADDVCNASLECVGGGPVQCADDGSACTSETCQAPMGCVSVPAPASSCDTSNRKGVLQLRNGTKNGAKDRVLVQLLQGSSLVGDFGEPTEDSDYTVCVYDAGRTVTSISVPAGGSCGPKDQPCWKKTGPTATPNGVQNKEPLATNDGATLLLGTVSSKGLSNLSFRGVGSQLPAMDLAFLRYPLRVQVRTSEGQCWEQVFSQADEKKNTGSLFKAVHKAP